MASWTPDSADGNEGVCPLENMVGSVLREDASVDAKAKTPAPAATHVKNAADAKIIRIWFNFFVN